MKKKIERKWIVFSAFLAILVITATIFLTDKDKVIESVSRITPLQIFSLLGLATFSLILRVFRWKLLLGAGGVDKPISQVAAPFTSSMAANLLTPGKVGDVLRCFLLKGVKVHESIGSVIVERVMDMALILALVFVFVSGGGKGVSILPALVCAIAVAGVVLVFSSRRLARFLFSTVLGKFPFFEPFSKQLKSVYDSVRFIKHSPYFYFSAALTVLIWSIDFYYISLIAAYLGMHISLFTIAEITSVAAVIGTATMIPGGLGGIEASTIYLLGLLGFASYQAASFILVQRLVSYWYIILLGLLSFNFV